MDKYCDEHSGMLARIKSLEARAQGWDEMEKEVGKVRSEIMGRLNIVLGSSLICALGLIGNLIFRVV